MSSVNKCIRRMRWHSGLALVLGFALALTALPAGAQTDSEATTLERQVKAAFVFKFGTFVEWPDAAFPQPDTPFSIAVMGDDQLAAELEQLTVARRINTRVVTVKRVKESDSLAGVHVLFVGRSDITRIRAVKPRPILVVSAAQGALAQGSVINFVLTEGRVRFEVSLEAAEKRGLKLGSGLLSVALQVRR